MPDNTIEHTATAPLAAPARPGYPLPVRQRDMPPRLAVNDSRVCATWLYGYAADYTAARDGGVRPAAPPGAGQ